jgi:hypothetical protein
MTATAASATASFPRRQRGKLRLVAGQQDPLAILIAEAVGHLAMASVSAVHTVPITQESTPPTLEGGEPHPSSPAS